LAFVACFKGLAPKEKLGVTIKIPGVDEHLSTTQNVDTDQETNTVMITISPCVLPAAGQISIDYRFEDGTSFHRSIEAKVGPAPQ